MVDSEETQPGLQDLHMSIVSEAPLPNCEGWVQAAAYESRREKKDLMLKGLYVRAYDRENGRARLFFYPNKVGLEPLYILDLNSLRSVKSRVTSKNAPVQEVTYHLKFGEGHRIRTRLRRVKVAAHVLRFKAEVAPRWDDVLFKEGLRSAERRNKKALLRTKLKSILHKTTFHRFERKKTLEREFASREETELGIITSEAEQPPLPSSFTLEIDGLDVGEEQSAQLPNASSPHRAGRSAFEAGTEFFSCAELEGEDGVWSPSQDEGRDSDFVETTVRFDSGPESDGPSDTSVSSGEVETEMHRVNSHSVNSDPVVEPLEGPPFTSFARLCNTSEAVRFATWPTEDEFNILLEFEALMDANEMEKNGWENKCQKDRIQIFTKKLPATVSSATLVSAQFVKINAPPEIIYLLIRNAKDRLAWDENIKQLDVVEEDAQGREIEYCVCKAPIGFSNREFLKYRICKAEYQQYPYMMVMRSCVRDNQPVGRNNVRAESVINGYIIRPDDGDPWTTRISIAANTDVKGLIPTWAVDAMASRLPPRWVSTLEAAAMKYMKTHGITVGSDLSSLLPS